MAQKKSTPKPESGRAPATPEMRIYIPLILFALTTILFFLDHLAGSAYFWEDFAEFVYPVQTFAATESARGNLPFWNPYSFAGMPFLADIQVGFFYPFNRVLTLFVSDGRLPVYILQFMIIIHFFFAQLGMYLLARRWKISPMGSIIASVSYGFSFMLVFHVIHPMIVYHLAWLPLVLYFFSKALAGRKIRSGIIAGIIFGISMLAGHPQMSLFEGFFLGIFFIWTFIAEIRNGELKGGKIGRFIIAGLVTFIVAAGIFAVQLLPSNQLAGLSERQEMTYKGAVEGSLRFKQIYTSVVPKLFGYQNAADDQTVPHYLLKDENNGGGSPYEPHYNYWETAFYFGVGALMLGLFGAICLYPDRRVAFLIFVAVFGFLFALGGNSFIYPIFHDLPFFGNFRNPARMMFFFMLAFTLMAGYGFDRLSASSDKRKMLKFIIAGGIPLLIAILVSSGALPSMLDTPDQFAAEVSSFGLKSLGFIVAIAFVAIMMIAGRIKPMIGGGVIIALIFIDLYIAGADFNRSGINPEDRYQLDPRMEKTLTPNYPDDLFRVNMRSYNPPYMAMQRNQGMVDRIMLLEGYNPLRLERIVPPLKPTDPESDKQRVHDLLNVKYEIAVDPQAGSVGFVERSNYPGRAWMVHRAEIIRPDKVKEYMENNYIDFAKMAVIEKSPDNAMPDNPDSIYADQVKCLEYRNDYMKFEVSAIDNGLLVFSEIWYPAWRADIDGLPTEILRTNYSLRGVSVPKGRHIVELSYESEPFKTGLIVSLFTLLIAGLFYAVLWRMEQRRRTKERATEK